MDDKVKLIILAAGGMVGSFVLFFLVFYFVFPPEAETVGEAAAERPEAGQGIGLTALGQRGKDYGSHVRSGGEDILFYFHEMGETIPLYPKIEGYGTAGWGMSMEEILGGLGSLSDKTDAVVEQYTPPDSAFTNLVVLNPDNRHLKVEYRFYRDRLFYIDVYYALESKEFDALLMRMMRRYGKQYEQYASADELGNIVINVSWDTDGSLIELVSRPNGRYSISFRSQEIIYELEEVRKKAERSEL